MGKRTLLATSLLATSIAAYGPVHAQEARSGSSLSDRIKRALDAHADCSALKSLWREARPETALPPNDPDRSTFVSRKARLYDRRRELRCGQSGRGPAPRISAWESYESLLASIIKLRESCPAQGECPGLAEAEVELMQITLVNVRTLPVRDPRRKALQKDLGTVFSGSMSLKDVLGRLAHSKLSPEEASSVLDLTLGIAARGSQGVTAAEKLITGIRDVKPKDVNPVVDAAIALYKASGGDAELLARKLTIAPLVMNDEGREVLRVALEGLARRYPAVQKQPEFMGAMKELKGPIPDEVLLRGFLEQMDKTLFDPLDREVDRLRNWRPPPDLEDRILVLFYSPHAAVEDAGDTRGFGRRFFESFVKRLQGRAPQGVRMPVSLDAQKLETVESVAQKIFTASRGNTADRSPCDSSLPDPVARVLCYQPWGGVMTIAFQEEPGGDAFTARVKCWTPVKDQLTFASIPESRVNKSDLQGQNAAGTLLGIDTIERCTLFAQTAAPQESEGRSRIEDKGTPPERSLTRPSRFNVIPLAGLPYLRDGEPNNDTRGWTMSALDLSFLSCVLGTGAWSIYKRNQYADSPNGDLGTADGYLTASAICFGGWVVTKILAASLY